MTRDDVIENYVTQAWMHVQRLADLPPSELAPHLCGLAEIYEKLGVAVEAASANRKG
jgi:hypothetical protein